METSQEACSSPTVGRHGAEEADVELPDVTAQYEGEADFGSIFSMASDPEDERWVPMYGFQGAVHFVAGNWDSFRSAVRRLLSLPEPNAGAGAEADREPYTLVHYDEADGSIVEVNDDLFMGNESPGIDYLTKHFVNKTDDHDLYYNDTGTDVDINTRTASRVPSPGIQHSAFFVHFRDERTPRLWQPTNGQLLTDVSRIVYHASQDQPTPPPPSCAYVSFPKTAGGPDGRHAGSWDAAQSTAAVRTAVDVLVGQRCHDVFRFHTDFGDGAEDGTSISYGLATLRPGDVHALHALQRRAASRAPDEPPRDVHLEHRHLADDHVALVLPGFHPRAGECVSLITVADLKARGVSSAPRTLTSTPQLVLPGAAAAAAAARIRIMVARFQDAVSDEAVRNADCATELRSVRLLVGSPGDGSELRHQRQLLLPLRDKPGAILDPVAAHALSALADAPPRSILIFPEYRRRDTRMMAGWKNDAEHEPEDHDDRNSVALPALGSSAAEFREHVAQLCRLVPLSGDNSLTYDPRVHHVSIRPLAPATSSDEQGTARDARFESAMFYLGPDATDDDWFRVRAQIPTRKAVINLCPQTKNLDWRMSVARANIWGPRYGRVVAAPEKQEALVPFYRTPVARRNGTLEDVFAPKTRPTPTPTRPETRPPPVPPPVFQTPPAVQEKPEAHIQCPFKGCDFTAWETDQQRGRLALDAHALMRHFARQCLWCDERLGDDDERDYHLRTRHHDELMAIIGATSKNAREARAGTVVARERGETAVPREMAQPGMARDQVRDAAPRSSASPANQEQDEEANKEYRPVVVAVEDEETEREDSPAAPLNDDDKENNPADLLGRTGLVPSASLSPRSREHWAIGLRFNVALAALVDAENEQQRDSADDFEVYQDVEQDEGGGGEGSQTLAGRGALAELPTALDDAAATTLQAEQEVDQAGVANEGHGSDKAPEAKKGAETRGKKRGRLVADERGEDAAADEAPAKRTKTAKGARATRATGANKKPSTAQKKRKAPASTSAPVDDDAPPPPKRARKQRGPPAEPTRRSARLRGKAGGG